MGLWEAIEQAKKKLSKDTTPLYQDSTQATRLYEVVHWLKPCPICNGCEFYESINGGYFCPDCQPRPEVARKRLVRAKDRQPARYTGYGCAGCGTNDYRQVKDGWRCSGCGAVFDIIGGSRGPKIIN